MNAAAPIEIGCRSRFSATNALPINTQGAEKTSSVGLLTYAPGKRVASFPALFSLPGDFSSDRFSPRTKRSHLQRRYRSGITPDYLVQQLQPYAAPATEWVFHCCRKNCNTAAALCQQQYTPRQQKSCTIQHRQICHRPPRSWKPRKLPACRR